MKKSVLPLLIVLLAIIGGIAWYHFSDSQVRKRAIQASLNRFSEAIATKDRTKVSAALGQLLTADAKVRLEVYFFSLTNNRPAMTQDFDKAGFITFIDTTLYPLTDYSYTPSLTSVDAKTGKVAFTSVEWADGANMMGGIAVDMRYGSNSTCEGVSVMEGEVAKLQQASCTLQFRQVPKPGQENKFMNQNSLMDLLKK